MNAVPREPVLTVWGLQGRCPRKVLAQASLAVLASLYISKGLCETQENSLWSWKRGNNAFWSSRWNMNF